MPLLCISTNYQLNYEILCVALLAYHHFSLIAINHTCTILSVICNASFCGGFFQLHS